MAGTGQVQVLGRTIERSRLIAAVLTILAIVFMVIGVAISGPIGTVLAAMGSTFGTTALVSFLYDIFLKEVLAEEIFKHVGLKESIVQAGLEDIAGSDGYPLAALLAGCHTVHALPLDPFSWARENYQHVVSTAKNAQLDVAIILPSPEPGEVRGLIAHRLDMGENELERKLKTLPQELIEKWDDASTTDGSTLKIFVLDGMATCGLFYCDLFAIIDTGPAVHRSQTDSTVLGQRFRPGSIYFEWTQDQLSAIIKNATQEGERPLPPSPHVHVPAEGAVASQQQERPHVS